MIKLQQTTFDYSNNTKTEVFTIELVPALNDYTMNSWF